jgi:hypothetical protein
MIYDNEYEYDYHDLAKNSEYLYEDESYVSDDIDESFSTKENNEQDNINNNRWDNYYHNLADEIIDD